MDILLVTPPRTRRQVVEETGENLGVSYLAAVLRQKGHRVKILDADLEGLKVDELARRITTTSFDVLGLSVIFASMVEPARALVGRLKDKDRYPIVAGGHVPSLSYRAFMADLPDVDYVVRGEGEITFLKLVEGLDRGEAPGEIPGIAYRREGEVHTTTGRSLVSDLDLLPPPARDTLGLALKGPRPAATLLSSRGCYGDCSFCSINAFYRLSEGPRWRAHSPGRVVDEMEKLHKDWGLTAVRFSDDNFIGPGRRGRERAEAIARELVRRRLRLDFTISCRADDIEPDLFLLLKEAGLKQVFLGIESGVQRALDSFNKKVSVQQNRRAVEILDELGLDRVIGFILFDPDTTLDEFVRNVDFMQEIGLSWQSLNSRLDVMNRLEVYDGTPVAERLRREGRLQGTYTNYSYRITDVRVEAIYRLLTTCQKGAFAAKGLFRRLVSGTGLGP